MDDKEKLLAEAVELLAVAYHQLSGAAEPGLHEKIEDLLRRAGKPIFAEPPLG